MKKVFSYFKYYLKESILAPLFKLLEASLELLIPIIVAKIIDRGIANQDTGYIIKMVMLQSLSAPDLSEMMEMPSFHLHMLLSIL